MRWTLVDAVSYSAWRVALLAATVMVVGCGGSSETAPVASSTPAAAPAGGEDAGGGGAGYGDDEASVDAGGGAGYGDDASVDAGGGAGYGEDSGGGDGYGDEPSGYSGDGGAGYGDMGYGEGYGQRPQAASPLQAALAGFAAPLSSKFSAALADPAASGPVSLLDQSATAFMAGNEALAEQLLYAHLIADPHNASEQFQAAAWSPAMRRPVWAVRWGVSFHLRTDDELVDPHPVIDDMPSPLGSGGGRGRNMRGGGSESDYGSAEESYAPEEMLNTDGEPVTGRGDATMANQTSATLAQNLGLAAQIAGEMFDARFSNGDFGNVFPAMAPVVTLPAVVPPGQGGEGGGGAGYGSDGGGAGYGESSPGDETMEADAGSSVDPMRSPEMQSDAGGGAGYGEERMASGYGPSPAAGAGIVPSAPTVPEPQLPRWRPGIVFVGQGVSEETIATARSHGIDFLLHFDIKAGKVGVDRFENVTRARVVSVADGSTVVASKAIDNIEIYNRVNPGEQRTTRMPMVRGARRNTAGPTERKLVTEALTNLFEAVDEKLRIAPLPPVTPELVTARVGALIASADASKLRTLAEIRLYEFLGLLPAADLQTAMTVAVGDRGLIMLYASPSQRRETVLAMVDEALEQM